MEQSSLTWADIWVLQAIYVAQSPVLEKIIAAADGLDHAVLTCTEFNNAIYNLAHAGLLSNAEQTISLTEAATTLLGKFSGQSYLKQAESIRTQLGVAGWSKDYDPNRLTAPELFVSKGRFHNAAQVYLSRHGR